MRPWHWLLLVAALVVPLQAVALDEGGGAGLSASASLGVCGVAETGITCRIDVSWSGVEGAERYTASATLADGSVRDLGTVGIGSGGGSTSVWVPYVGDGTYSVTITAWGTEDGKEKKLEDGKAKVEADKPDKPDKPEKSAEPKPPADDGEGDGDGPEQPAPRRAASPPARSPSRSRTPSRPRSPSRSRRPSLPEPAPEPAPAPTPEEGRGRRDRHQRGARGALNPARRRAVRRGRTPAGAHR